MDNYIDRAHARSISACNVLLTVRMCYVRVSSRVCVSGRVWVSSSRVRFCARSTTYYTHLSTVRAHGQQHRAYTILTLTLTLTLTRGLSLDNASLPSFSPQKCMTCCYIRFVDFSSGNFSRLMSLLSLLAPKKRIVPNSLPSS